MKNFLLAIFSILAFYGNSSAAIYCQSLSGGAPITVTTLAAAAGSKSCINTSVVVTTALSAVQSNISSATLPGGRWPSDRALKVEKGGSIDPTTAFSGLPYAEPEWFGAAGDNATDDYGALVKAVASTRKLKLSKTYYSSGQLVLPVDLNGYVIEGVNSRNTGIRFGNSDYGLTVPGVNGTGGNAPRGSTYNFRNVLFYSLSATGKGLFISSVAKVIMEDVKFSGFNGGEQLVLNQVFDSWLNRVYWQSHVHSGTYATLLLDSGTADNVNNIRFDGCAFELDGNYDDLRIVTSSGGLSNYNIVFDKFKWESQPAHAKISTIGGLISNLVFTNGIWAANAGGIPVILMDATSTVRNLVVNNNSIVYNFSGTTGTIPYLFSLNNAKNVSFMNSLITTNLATLTIPCVITGTSDNYYSVGAMLNSAAVSLFFDTTAATALTFSTPLKIVSRNGAASMEQFRYNSSGVLVGKSMATINASGGLDFYIDGVLMFTIQKNLPQYSILGTRYAEVDTAVTPINTVYINSVTHKLTFKDSAGADHLLY